MRYIINFLSLKSQIYLLSFVLGLLTSTALFSQSYSIEKGMFGLQKVKFIENSHIEISDNTIVFDTRFKYQPNRTNTVYNIVNKEVGASVTYFELAFTEVGTIDYIGKMYLYKDRIIMIIIDLITKQSQTIVYQIKAKNVII